MICYDGQRFTWRKKIGTVDASDLRMGAWPERFQVRSHRTGDVDTFRMRYMKRDDEGDVLFVDYVGYTGAGITIFND